MRVGFTGTREGMTESQMLRVKEKIVLLSPSVVIHGGCVGSDKQFHDICVELGVKNIVVYPGHPKGKPNETEMQAGIEEVQEKVQVMLPRPYLERNELIVNGCDLLLATPRDDTKKGGTWWTIKFAEGINKEVEIILP